MPVRSRHSVAAACLAAGLVTLVSACGLNVSPQLRAQGIRGATGQGGASSSVNAAPQVGVVGAPTTTASATATPMGPGISVGSAGAAPSGPGGAAASTSGAAPVPAAGNGGATDIGVTANQITVGSVATLSGPVPGLFAGDVYGARAYFAYINRLGGVYGRQLNLAVADDQLDCGQNRTQHLTLQPKVLGFVSSLSLYDNCGAPVVAANKTTPDVSLSFSTQLANLQNSFSINPLVPGYRLGPLQYYKAKYPDAIGHLATLVGNIGSAVQIWQGIKAAAESIGYNVAYERDYNAGETDFTADIIQMRQKGVKMLYFVSADSHTIAKVLAAAAQQNWTPQIIAVGAGDAAYDPGFLAEAGSAANGLMADQGQAAFFSPSDASIPGVKLYQEWMSKIGETAHEDLYSAWGWASARLAVQGLNAAGPKLTRVSWLEALKSIHHFDGDGMFAPTDPSAKKPATCYLLLKVVNGQWQRQDDPANAFRCDAGYYYYKP